MNDKASLAGKPKERPRGLATLTLAYGAVVFVWLTPEWDNVALVALLGWAGAILTAAHLRVRFRLLPVWGALVGAGSALFAAGLMFFKTALHAHPYPDFSPLLMLAVIERAPAWALAGALAGLGLLLLRNVFSRTQPTT